jgi:hypothetical protein
LWSEFKWNATRFGARKSQLSLSKILCETFHGRIVNSVNYFAHRDSLHFTQATHNSQPTTWQQGTNSRWHVWQEQKSRRTNRRCDAQQSR